jgi:hypothetical protein
MLGNIQQHAQAVLQAATVCLQSAIHHHWHWHLRKDSSASAQLKQQLQELQADMDGFHRHLTHWQEVRHRDPSEGLPGVY